MLAGEKAMETFGGPAPANEASQATAFGLVRRGRTKKRVTVKKRIAHGAKNEEPRRKGEEKRRETMAARESDDRVVVVATDTWASAGL
jgi:hypothetical protein